MGRKTVGETKNIRTMKYPWRYLPVPHFSIDSSSVDRFVLAPFVVLVTVYLVFEITGGIIFVVVFSIG